NLSGAELRDVNLQSSRLIRVNLSQANLAGVNLADAELIGVILDTTTVLPDSMIINKSIIKPRYDKYWTPDVDMSRYIDRNHPDFWQPAWSAAEYDSNWKWFTNDAPEPWVDAGYEWDKWNEWVRDGKPAHKPTDDTES
ncbi:MAG: pentapeptide repeat-containing protein, partial [Chloroflexota bacterium]